MNEHEEFLQLILDGYDQTTYAEILYRKDVLSTLDLEEEIEDLCVMADITVLQSYFYFSEILGFNPTRSFNDNARICRAFYRQILRWNQDREENFLINMLDDEVLDEGYATGPEV